MFMDRHEVVSLPAASPQSAFPGTHRIFLVFQSPILPGAHFAQVLPQLDEPYVLFVIIAPFPGQNFIDPTEDERSPQSACHPKPKYLRQVERNHCDAGATIWRTSATRKVDMFSRR